MINLEIVNNPVKFREYLLSLQNKKYQQFHEKIIKSEANILGIPIPTLREIAKEIARTDAREFITSDSLYFDELAVKGFVIGYSKISMDETLDYLKEYVQKIDNWGICDTTIASLKIFKKNKEKGLDFIKECLKDDREFVIRYGLVLLLAYYIDDEYIDYIIDVCSTIKSDYYYVNMALACLISISFIKYQDKSMVLFDGRLDKFVHNKSISKICDSYRVTEEDKKMIKLKRLK